MSRLVSVWLPRWPIRRFLAAQAREESTKRLERDWREKPASTFSHPAPGKPIDPDLPFILSTDASGGARIAALNEAASREQLEIGDRLADARAKTDVLQVRDADPKADDAALRKLALWAMRYSPSVAPFGEHDGADGLFIDISGVAHLFGGERKLIEDLARRLSGFGFPSRIAVADTAGAAWAMARLDQNDLGSNRSKIMNGIDSKILERDWREKPVSAFPHPAPGAEPFRILRSGDEAKALADLPVAALRLPEDMRLALRRLGFTRVRQLIDAPRAPFAVRFESELLMRLDQALGRAPEPLALIETPPLYHARRPLLEPIFSQEAVVTVAADLMRDLDPQLTRDGVGARRLRLSLYRVDGDVASLDIGTALPTRDPTHVRKLVDLRLDRLGNALDARFGFEALSLSALSVETMQERQISFLAGRGAATRDHGLALIDRLRQRLGPAHVRRLRPVASHLPERAEAPSPADKEPASWPRPDASRLRPTLLLRQPEEAAVMTLVPHEAPRHFRWRGRQHAVARQQGPERIAGEWWREEQPTRDYYVVEDERGRRFWLYREGIPDRETETPRWFVHGLFA